jgi:hypothetical protein
MLMYRTTAGVGVLKYAQTFHWNTMALPKLSEDILTKAFGWYEKIQTVADGALGPYASLVLELFCTSDSKAGRLSSGWPRPAGFKHMVLIQTGAPTTGELNDLSKQILRDGPKEILGPHAKLDVTTNALEEFHDMRAVSSNQPMSTRSQANNNRYMARTTISCRSSRESMIRRTGSKDPLLCEAGADGMEHSIELKNLYY